MNKIFLLGAKDPEMNEIEKILNENNQKYLYAEINGERCHPGNAYEADNSYMANNDLSSFNEIVFIECKTIKDYENSIYLDHHKKGDYGYDKRYHLFLDASSIGQVVAYLINNNTYKSKSEDFYMRASFNGFMYFDEQKSWYYRKSLNEFIPISEKIVLVAASDHSLSEAYNGLCVGVTNDKLIDERTIEIAEPFNNNIELVHKTMRKYMHNFKSHSSEIFDLRHLDLGIGYSIDYLCLRELAISYNQPILVNTQDSISSKERVMFLSLKEEVAKSILESKSYNGYLIDDIFGVPVRGYVGGKISDV